MFDYQISEFLFGDLGGVEISYVPCIVEEEGNGNIPLPAAVNLFNPAVVVDVGHDPHISSYFVGFKEGGEPALYLAREVEADEYEFHLFVLVLFRKFFKIWQLGDTRRAPCGPQVDHVQHILGACEDLLQLRNAYLFNLLCREGCQPDCHIYKYRQ